MTPSKAPAPPRALPAYQGAITGDSLRAVVTRANPKIKPATIANLKKGTEQIRRLVLAQEALSTESVRAAHRVSIESAVNSIRNGASPDSINTVQDVSSIASEYSAKRQTLREAQGSATLDTLDDLEDAGAEIIRAVDELALGTEYGERDDADAFRVEFRPSQQLLLIRSVSFLIKQRFNGIREVVTRDPVHAGSPQTMLHDLLPEASTW